MAERDGARAAKDYAASDRAPRRARRDGARGHGHPRRNAGQTPRLSRASARDASRWTRQLTTWSSRGDRFSRSTPSAVTATMSSIRTPKSPLEVDRPARRRTSSRLPASLRSPSTMYGGSCTSQPDPVAGPMDEPLAHPGLLDDPARRAVDLFDRYPGRTAPTRGSLGSADRFVHALELPARLTHDHRAGRVAEVPAQLAPEVHHDEVAGRIVRPPVRGAAMRRSPRSPRS